MYQSIDASVYRPPERGEFRAHSIGLGILQASIFFPTEKNNRTKLEYETCFPPTTSSLLVHQVFYIFFPSILPGISRLK